jgi:predicted nuclease of restriction endonuclease-like RecB superfamily
MRKGIIFGMVALLSVTVLFGTGCDRKEKTKAGWESLMNDYSEMANKLIDLYSTESEAEKEQLQAEVSQLEERMSKTGRELEDQFDKLSAMEKIRFAKEFAEVNARIFQARASDIEKATEKAMGEMQKALEEMEAETKDAPVEDAE